MLLVYYNPTKDKFYLKYYKYKNREYYVGYKNQFGHEVIRLYIIQGKELISYDNVDDYMYENYNSKKRVPFKIKLINRLIDLLNKLK